MHDHDLHFDSKCIHGGQEACAVTGAVMPAIYTSSTYAQESPGVHRGYEYSRSHNLTRYSFERALASLEGTGLDESTDASHGGFAFSSGLAAAGTCLELLSQGGLLTRCGSRSGLGRDLITPGAKPADQRTLARLVERKPS